MATMKHAAYGSTQSPLTTQLNSLANNTNSAASSAIDNTSALDLYMDLELTVAAQGAARSAGATVSVYLTTSLDGTNFDDVNETTAELAATFLLDAATTQRRRTVRDVPIPGLNFKLFVRNATGQAFAGSGSTLRYKTHNLSSV